MSRFAKDSEFLRKEHQAYSFLIFLCVYFLAGAMSLPFSEEKSGTVITTVIVELDGVPNAENLGDLISIRQGEAYSLKRIRDNIRQIHKTGLFSDVRVSKSGEKEIRLTFSLSRRLLVRNINFAGGKKISPRSLRENLYSLRPNVPFSEDKLERAKEELKQILRRDGFFDTEIRADVFKDSKTSSVDINFEILSVKRYRIKRLSFEGEAVVPVRKLRESMKSREGKYYVPSLLDQDLIRLKDLYNSLGYQRAEIELGREEFDESDWSAALSLKVSPQEKITFKIKGAEVPVDVVKSIWEERIFEEWGLAEGEARILAYLRKKGYIFATVNSSIEKADNLIRAIHDVKPGERYKIRDVVFEGLKYFTPFQIRDELDIPGRILFFGSIDGERLFELPREIQNLYQTRGFPDAQVDLNFNKRDKKVNAVYYIEEGRQQRIKKIVFSGAALFKPEILLAQLGSSEGRPFFQPNIQKDIDRLENFYLDQGVRGTKIRAKVEEEPENQLDLLFEVSEGRKIKVDKIVIAGNVITRKNTILKEIRIKEGDDASYRLILESKRNLERLGIFSEVKIEEIPLTAESENLVISLREGKRNYASVGVGLETKNEPRTFEIWNNVLRLRGTAEIARSNVLGTASQLSFVSQLSIKETREVISWEQPYFFGYPVRTYLNAWLEREERTSFSFDQRGVSLTGIKQLSENWVLLATLRWTRTLLTYLDIMESEVDRQYFPFSATSLSGSLIWDRRNDTFNPEKGHFFSAVVEWAYPLFKAESDYLKSFLKYQQFVPVFSRLNFNTTVRLGLGRGRIPIHERFFGGGSNSFRGEEFDELGPKDPNSQKPVGGKALVLFNFELRFPVVSALKDLSGAVFYDMGNVFAKRSNFDLLAFKDAVGFGVRYRTPLGPLRFELAWNLDAPERKGKPLAFITIGNVF